MKCACVMCDSLQFDDSIGISPVILWQSGENVGGDGGGGDYYYDDGGGGGNFGGGGGGGGDFDGDGGD